jgi:hypothetical protein
MPQPGCNICVCGAPEAEHERGATEESLLSLFADEHVQRRLAGGPHVHHAACIPNLPPDEQIALRGRTREWWEAMGLRIPEQITPDQWEQAS